VSAVIHTHTHTHTQLPTSTVNVALPAFATQRRPCSCRSISPARRPGAQQQTRSSAVQRANYQTNHTDDRPLHRPCSVNDIALGTQQQTHSSTVQRANDGTDTDGRTVTDPAVRTMRVVSMIHTHTHQFNGPLSGTTRVSRYQKGETNLDFTEAKDSEWQ